MLERSGVGTGIDLTAMIGVNRWFAEILGRPLPSRVARATPS